LPDHLIAQEPCPDRTHSRLLVISRELGTCEHSRFYRIREYLREGDLLVVNNSKVVPARLIGRKSTGGRVDVLVLSPASPQDEGNSSGDGLFQEREWFCLMRCSGTPRPGTELHFGDDIQATILQKEGDGIWKIRFRTQGDLLNGFCRVGYPPLPPYIRRPDPQRSSLLDRERYQTVFAKIPGSVAAPTAGLHFSREFCQRLEKGGILFAEITLHVGLATFRPIRTSDVRQHSLSPERYSISEETSAKIKEAKQEGRRIIAVGTTVVRCLESAAHDYGEITPHEGVATSYILPGYSFQIINAIITNFHLPRTSLLVLVSAFAGRATVLHAYQEAMREGYRFFSYGDAMLIH
jgi:S-adenosylmethionine:tRNA ribosyltransferase-isomerase